jgi:hypothetical protein
MKLSFYTKIAFLCLEVANMIKNKHSFIFYSCLVIIITLTGCYNGYFFLERSSGWQPFGHKEIDVIKMFKAIQIDSIDSITIELYHLIDSNNYRKWLKYSKRQDHKNLVYEETKIGQSQKYINTEVLDLSARSIVIIIKKTDLKFIENSCQNYINNSIRLLELNKASDFPTGGRTSFTNNLDSNSFNNLRINNEYYGDISIYNKEFVYFSQFYPNELYFKFFFNNYTKQVGYDYHPLTFPRVAADRFTNEFINSILQYKKRALSITDTNSKYDQWYKYE